MLQDVGMRTDKTEQKYASWRPVFETFFTQPRPCELFRVCDARTGVEQLASDGDHCIHIKAVIARYPRSSATPACASCPCTSTLQHIPLHGCLNRRQA